MTGSDTPSSASEIASVQAQPSPQGARGPEAAAVSAGAAPGRSAALRALKRTLFALAGVGVFFGVASFIKPAPRQASASVPNPVQLTIPASALGEHPKGWKVLGTLQGKNLLVRAYASPEGPRYSVYSTAGQLLQADLPADEVYRAFPEADLQNMRLEPGVPSNALMLHSGTIGD